MIVSIASQVNNRYTLCSPWAFDVLQLPHYYRDI